MRCQALIRNQFGYRILHENILRAIATHEYSRTSALTLGEWIVDDHGKPRKLGYSMSMTLHHGQHFGNSHAAVKHGHLIFDQRICLGNAAVLR